MKQVLQVDFDNRDNKDRLYLSEEISNRVKLKENVWLSDGDIAVCGQVHKISNKTYVQINWNTTKYRDLEKLS